MQCSDTTVSSGAALSSLMHHVHLCCMVSRFQVSRFQRALIYFKHSRWWRHKLRHA